MKALALILSILMSSFSLANGQEKKPADSEKQQIKWSQHRMSFEVPETMDKVYVQKDECGASGGGIKLEMVHVGEMNVIEELSFFEGILVFQHQDPTDIWPAEFTARLISGYYGKVRIYILAFNDKKGDAFAAIAYFDDDDETKEESVRAIFRSIRFDN